MCGCSVCCDKWRRYACHLCALVRSAAVYRWKPENFGHGAVADAWAASYIPRALVVSVSAVLLSLCDDVGAATLPLSRRPAAAPPPPALTLSCVVAPPCPTTRVVDRAQRSKRISRLLAWVRHPSPLQVGDMPRAASLPRVARHPLGCCCRADDAAQAMGGGVGLFSFVELSIVAQGLAETDSLSAPDPMAVVFERDVKGTYVEIGRTEVICASAPPALLVSPSSVLACLPWYRVGVGVALPPLSHSRGCIAESATLLTPRAFVSACSEHQLAALCEAAASQVPI